MRDRIVGGFGHQPLRELFVAEDQIIQADTPCIWREIDGKCVGGFAYTGMGGGCIHLHFAGANRRWMSRDLLKAVFRYPFDELNLTTILGFIPCDRDHAQRVAIKLGFTRLGVIPGVQIHMFTMIRKECRWLELNSR